MVARTGAATPLAKASTLLTELAGITQTTKRVERSAEADGAAIGARLDTEAALVLSGHLLPLAAAKPVAKLYTAVDGTGVPMVPAETAGRAGTAADGLAHTREVKLGVLFTQPSLDDKGRPVCDAGSSSYLATSEPVEQFGLLVHAEARRHGVAHAQQLVVCRRRRTMDLEPRNETLPDRDPNRGPLPRPRAPTPPRRPGRTHPGRARPRLAHRPAHRPRPRRH